MAHEFDLTTGHAAIAYVQGSETPWHGLGQTVDSSAPIATWKKAAGLDWEAKRAEVSYHNAATGQVESYPEKHVLYRSDTGRPLSVVSSDYKTVQPDDILGFFGELAASGGFRIETVGALKEGRRIWALARVGETARILDDQVAPYLLLATSYDGTLATLAKFTAVRVVCRNTLQTSLRNDARQTQVTISHRRSSTPSSSGPGWTPSMTPSGASCTPPPSTSTTRRAGSGTTAATPPGSDRARGSGARLRPGGKLAA